jgi:DNA polymerase
MSPTRRSGSAQPARPGAADYVPDGADLDGLAEAAQHCQGCELFRDATQAVMGAGPLDAALMLVGEQPGDVEDRQGEPFVGPAGRLLDKALAAAGIEPAGVFRTNVVKHFRYEMRGKRRIHVTPDLSHMVACSPWFDAELELVRPRGLVVLGASAGKVIFGSSFRVTAMRGQVLQWPEEAKLHPRADWLLATTHPSAVLRSRQRDEAMDLLVADLRVAADALAG